MPEAIKYVRIAVREDHFDTLNTILVDMSIAKNWENDIDLPEQLRSDYGIIEWTYGNSRVNDKWIEILISRSSLININKYGKPLDQLWKDYKEEDVDFIRADKHGVCTDCKKVHKDHPMDKRYIDNHGEPWLNRLCNGNFVKL